MLLSARQSAPGINRNIVECKGRNLIERQEKISVLIETLWNVKMTEWMISVFMSISINRNIVECKE